MLKSAASLVCVLAAGVLMIAFMDESAKRIEPERPPYLYPAIVENAYHDGQLCDRDLYGPNPCIWINESFFWQPEEWQHDLLSEAWAWARQQGSDPKSLRILDAHDTEIGRFGGAKVEWNAVVSERME